MSDCFTQSWHIFMWDKKSRVSIASKVTVKSGVFVKVTENDTIVQYLLLLWVKNSFQVSKRRILYKNKLK